MQTLFTDDQLADPGIAEAEGILRSCVHCGFCQATCPTYVLRGDELDSPRGRIYLVKTMLESGGTPNAKLVGHIDRCLSCLSCMTTCPSSVDYMHLVDLARERIERTHRRPWDQRLLRRMLRIVLPAPHLLAPLLALAALAGPLARRLPGALGRMARLAPRGRPAWKPPAGGRVHPAEGPRCRRVALLAGCVQQVMGRAIDAATIRLLTRNGCEVVLAPGAGCCGAVAHHLGDRERGRRSAAANLDAWQTEIDGEGLDAIVVNASGCGAMVKDYGHLFRDDPERAEAAARVAHLALDVTELAAHIAPRFAAAPPRLRIAYHSACALQHGQGIHVEPARLLARAGFEVVEPAEPHLCCGSAGTYNILQPAIAERLGARKAAALEALDPVAIAAGNIGCIAQIGARTPRPVVHTVELLDWADGGPPPAGLAGGGDAPGMTLRNASASGSPVPTPSRRDSPSSG